MKIYLNREPVTGPWGGGNKSLSMLSSEIIKRGHTLVYDLEPGIDVIFCFDPRPNNKGKWYGDFAQYRSRNPGTKIVQRVGDVGTHSKPELTELLKSIAKIKTTDFFIFPSRWARKMIDHQGENYAVVPNRPLSIFYKNRSEEVSNDSIRIVTHHWSNNAKKGFSIYEKLGKAISDGLKINGKGLEFTYVGRYSTSHSTNGIKIKDPIDSNSLSLELPMHDIYLTASLEEAGANHVLEAMAAGLPIIFREGGGSITEYCSDFGEKYNSFEQLLEKIEEVDKNHQSSKIKVKKYSEKIEDTVSEYVRIIEKEFNRSL